jgi:uncharacterized protein (DUF433 family)
MNSIIQSKPPLTGEDSRVQRRKVQPRTNLADVAAYSLREAAALIGVPMSTLHKWTKGRTFPTKRGTQASAPIIETPAPHFLSFTNIVEAHILAGFRRERVALEKIRRAVRFVDRHYRVKHALALEDFQTDGVDLFIERLDHGLVNASRDGQNAMRAIVETHLRRVEYKHGRAIRLFPLIRPTRVGAQILPQGDAPRTVVIDPHRAFGRPVLNGTSVPVEDIFSRWQRGEGIQQLASDYEVTPAEIEEALRAAKAA